MKRLCALREGFLASFHTRPHFINTDPVQLLVCAKTIRISKRTFTSIQIYMARSTGKKILATIMVMGGREEGWMGSGRAGTDLLWPIQLSSPLHPAPLAQSWTLHPSPMVTAQSVLCTSNTATCSPQTLNKSMWAKFPPQPGTASTKVQQSQKSY